MAGCGTIHYPLSRLDTVTATWILSVHTYASGQTTPQNRLSKSVKSEIKGKLNHTYTSGQTTTQNRL